MRVQRPGQAIEGGAAQEVQLGAVRRVAQVTRGFRDDGVVLVVGGQCPDEVAARSGMGRISRQNVPERADRCRSFAVPQLGQAGHVPRAGFIGCSRHRAVLTRTG